MTKNCSNRIKPFKLTGTEYVDPSSANSVQIDQNV